MTHLKAFIALAVTTAALVVASAAVAGLPSEPATGGAVVVTLPVSGEPREAIPAASSPRSRPVRGEPRTSVFAATSGGLIGHSAPSGSTADERDWTTLGGAGALVLVLGILTAALATRRRGTAALP